MTKENNVFFANKSFYYVFLPSAVYNNCRRCAVRFNFVCIVCCCMLLTWGIHIIIRVVCIVFCQVYDRRPFCCGTESCLVRLRNTFSHKLASERHSRCKNPWTIRFNSLCRTCSNNRRLHSRLSASAQQAQFTYRCPYSKCYSYCVALPSCTNTPVNIRCRYINAGCSTDRHLSNPKKNLPVPRSDVSMDILSTVHGRITFIFLVIVNSLSC